MLSVQQIQDLNVAMLGLGAPIEKDNKGYNKPDFTRMETIGMLAVDLSPEEAYAVLNTLQKYRNTQLKPYKDEINETLSSFTKKMEELYPKGKEDNWECTVTMAQYGIGHNDCDYRHRLLTFIKSEGEYIYVAFQEYISDFNPRAYGGKWDKQPDGTFAVKIPFKSLEKFADAALRMGKYGYEIPQELKDAYNQYMAQKAQEPEEAPKPVVFTFLGIKDSYGHDVFELNINEYEFNQKLWNLKGDGLSYVNVKAFPDKVLISTNEQMLPKLIVFLKENSVDVSAVENAPRPVAEKTNESENRLVDVTKLDLPFKPYPFQIEDAKVIVGKKKAMLGHEMGCVSGKSKVRIKENGKAATRKVYIDNLFKLIQKDPTIQIKSLVNGRFSYMPIKAVIDKGVRNTIRIETEKGFIECTPDHEIYTEHGWIEAEKLSVGDIVFSDSLPEEHDKKGFSVPQKAVVTNIQPASKQQVYDIAIDDPEIHNFVCNGIVVHNCGKTFISALVGMSIPEKKLVICPETLRLNWKRELENVHKGADIRIVYSKDTNPEFGKDWTIMGYKTAVKFESLIAASGFNCLFVDEAHKCKAVNNYGRPSSRQAETVMLLAQNMTYTYLLTGTPMPTRNKDLYNELVMLGEIDTYQRYAFHEFGKKFCNGVGTRYGWDYSGNSHTEELHEILKKYMTRRLKADVLPNLKKQRMPIIINEPLSREYKEIESRLHKMLDDDTYMGLAMKGRNALSKCKVRSAIDFAETILEGGELVVIVTEFNDTMEKIMKHFGNKACCIKGGMSDAEKQRAIDDFQNGEKEVCCINLIAAGVGITLTKAHNMVICDFDWTPANMTQVEDRICRAGQNEQCNIYYICHEMSILDDIFLEMITKKSANIDKVVDNAENSVDLVGMRNNEKGTVSFIEKLKARIALDNGQVKDSQ